MSATFVSSAALAVSTQTTATSVTLTVSAPTSISIGNTLIVCLYDGTSTNSNVSWALTGWSFTTVTQAAGVGFMFIGVKTAVLADTTASNYAFVGSSDVSITWWMAAAILNYSGLGSTFSTTPSAVSVTTAATTIAAPAVSPVASTDLLLAFFGSYNGTTPSTTPAGMTTRASAATASREGIIALDQVLSAAGSTGTRTQTWSTADSAVGGLVTISPLAAAWRSRSTINLQAVDRSYTY